MPKEEFDLEQLVGIGDEHFGNMMAQIEAEMVQAEAERRSQAFEVAKQTLGLLKRDNQPALFFRTYAEDVFRRDLLLIWHPKTRNHAPAIQTIVSDEKPSDQDIRKRVIASTEYIYRPLGNVITSKSCVIDVKANGELSLGPGNFLVQKQDDSPIAHVFYGMGYSREMPVDPPYVSQSELDQRRLTVASLQSLLAPMVRQTNEAEPVEYLFSLATS